MEIRRIELGLRQSEKYEHERNSVNWQFTS